MKKVLLIAAFAVFGFTQTQAQEEGFKVGVNAALPLGDYSEGYSFGAALDLGYLFDVADSFQVGAVTGYQHFFGKTETEEFFGTTVEFENDDAQFIPIAASARFFASEQFFFGADLGYALGLNDGNDGGFYYRPKVGYGLDSLAIVLSYTGVSFSDQTFSEGDFEVTVDGGTFSSLQLGVEFSF
tara:strand:- start:1320 stop:1871 length:552 start_codon:yes stop_codon:yes gene_type:complete